VLLLQDLQHAGLLVGKVGGDRDEIEIAAAEHAEDVLDARKIR
jgi:hypothetical protein